MEYTILVPNSVRQDIEEIVENYQRDRPEYAYRVFNALTAKIQSLKTFPSTGRIVPELLEYNISTYRELIESHWRILYRIEKSTVELVAILDARRNVQDLLVEKLKRNRG